MAAYNSWMNGRIYDVCAELSDEDRKLNREVYFDSIHGTLNHLLLGDKIWMGRFENVAVAVAGPDYGVTDLIWLPEVMATGPS